MRMSFLRFTTGSDICLGGNIKVIFISTSGIQRTPIAHTCTNTLELPETYENFIEFRTEIASLLTSNIWIMDIV